MVDALDLGDHPIRVPVGVQIRQASFPASDHLPVGLRQPGPTAEPREVELAHRLDPVADVGQDGEQEAAAPVPSDPSEGPLKVLDRQDA